MKNQNQTTELTNIALDKIYAHPNNPRKDLGDLTELSASIKENGIMQNITVVPKSDGKEGEYTVLIGHRRCEASRLAGLKEVPCKIVEGLSEAQQIEVMLCENMQRADITIEEQAESFQQLLLFGLTEEDIAKKTGFSRRTVQRRLNIAKIDADARKEAAFQLSFDDYEQLSKISSIEKRNEILKKASSSGDLTYKVEYALKEEKKAEQRKPFLDKIEALGIKPVPKSYKSWDGSWENVVKISMNDTAPEKIEESIDVTDKSLRYTIEEWSNNIAFVKENKGKKAADAKRKEEDSRRRAAQDLIKSKLEEFGSHLKEFAMLIYNGEVKNKMVKDAGIIAFAWDMIIHNESYSNGVPSFWTLMNRLDADAFKSYYCSDDNKPYAQAEETLSQISVAKQMLFVAADIIKGYPSRLVDSYHCRYKADGVAVVQNAVDFLSQYGFVLEDEEKALLDGTHEGYMPEVTADCTADDVEDDEYEDDEYEDDEYEDAADDDASEEEAQAEYEALAQAEYEAQLAAEAEDTVA